ncbi:MAG: heterodisulfide reductase-related iron-sulfur binding cluster [Acidimicrobiia bacterium]
MLRRLRVKPVTFVLVVGALAALGTLASAVAPKLFQDEPSTLAGELKKMASEKERLTFVNIPAPMYWAFYACVAAMLMITAWLVAQRVRNYTRGKPDNRRTTKRNVKQRMEDFRAGVWMQTLMRDPAAGVMHSCIYFGFMVLFVCTVLLEIDHQVPSSLKFLNGNVYLAYSFIADLAGVVFLVGIFWAIARRYIARPYRIRIKTKPEDAWILGTFAAIGITGFAIEMFRIALLRKAALLPGIPSADYEKWSFVGWPLSSLVKGWTVANLESWHQWMWGLHFLAFVLFLVILPTTKLRHMITSPMNMYWRDRERPKGAMRPMPNLMETELDTFGAATVEDFTWKQLFDTDACTICGRCTAQCPAHATGKPLDPREIVLKVGEVMAATGDPVVSPPVGTDRDITVTADNVFERITAEEIWSCTSCKACDEICPVNIEILDKILDMRRYLSLMESNFPSELGNAYRAMENQGNPWGMNQGERADWAEGLDVKVVDPGEPFSAEYLYWVGCAGSFDDKNKKVTQAMAKLLRRAGIEVAILGPSEMCTGDSARRSGNEYLFQMLAMPNIEMLDGMGVKKIITQCPHCFNTLKNEYPQLGGNYEVIHHSQLLEQLVEAGRLNVAGATLEERVTYHDSCYLGRHNDVYLAPRKVVGSLAGIDLVEMPRNGTTAMCCGAGGGRFFMDEQTGKNVNIERAEQALATGASRVAVACPFCYVMLDDGVKAKGKGDDVKVQDISEVLLEAIEGKDNAAPTSTLGLKPGL